MDIYSYNEGEDIKKRGEAPLRHSVMLNLGSNKMTFCVPLVFTILVKTIRESGWASDIIGIALLAVVVLWQWSTRKSGPLATTG